MAPVQGPLICHILHSLAERKGGREGGREEEREEGSEEEREGVSK